LFKAWIVDWWSGINCANENLEATCFLTAPGVSAGIGFSNFYGYKIDEVEGVSLKKRGGGKEVEGKRHSKIISTNSCQGGVAGKNPYEHAPEATTRYQPIENGKEKKEITWKQRLAILGQYLWPSGSWALSTTLD
jgi:hypothetical protein